MVHGRRRRGSRLDAAELQRGPKDGGKALWLLRVGLHRRRTIRRSLVARREMDELYQLEVSLSRWPVSQSEPLRT